MTELTYSISTTERSSLVTGIINYAATTDGKLDVYARTRLSSIPPTWCPSERHHAIKLLSNRIVNIIQTRGQQVGDLPFTGYLATLNDGSKIRGKKAFHTTCLHCVPYKDSELLLELHPSYFEAIEEIFRRQENPEAETSGAI